MSTTDKIQELFHTLPEVEKKQLLAALALTLKKSTRAGVAERTQDRDVSMWWSSFYEALQGVVNSSAGLPSPGQLQELYKAEYEVVQKFMQDSKLRSLDVPQRLRVYQVLADILMLHCKRMTSYHDIPLSAKYAANNMQHLPELFDVAFPGYLRAGMARIAILGKFS